MVERLGEMRKGRRERIEKGSRERIIEKKERDKTREGGPERPPFYLDPTSWSSSIKIWFLQAYRIQKMSWCETECKNMCQW